MKWKIYVFLICVFSSTTTMANWTIRADNDFYMSITTNSKGSKLAVACDNPSDCSIFLAFDAKCDEGSKIPVLVNSKSFTGYIEATCSGRLDKELYFSMLDNFKELTNAFSKDNFIGFAMPLVEGLFRAERFSLDGYLKAEQDLIKRMKNKDSKVF